VPDKRQTSKQRRAARNRAAREALNARRTHAVTSSATPGSSRASSASGSADAASNGASTGGRAAGGGLLSGFARGRRRPGDMAVLVALGLAVVSAISMLFLRVPVDDRGEPLPNSFRGVAIAAREAVTGQEMPDRSKSLLDANGAGVLLYIALPVAVAAFAFWANRRPDRGRLLTFAMLAMAGAVLLGGGFFFFPSLIALAVASFQIRKADMPARVAERATATRGRGDAIDAESEELDDQTSDDDEGDDATDEDADPLAELEAELEAEEQARKDRGGDAAGGATSGG
jgi:hypothetical protein